MAIWKLEIGSYFPVSITIFVFQITDSLFKERPASSGPSIIRFNLIILKSTCQVVFHPILFLCLSISCYKFLFLIFNF